MRRGLGCLLLVFLGCSKEPAQNIAEPEPRPSAAWPPKHERDDTEVVRDRMVRSQIEARGVRDTLVLDAMRAVPRHLFVPAAERNRAYWDQPLPIGWDQTISQPYIVASMTEELRLKAGMKVLEIGTGSGYQAAVLAQITPHVYTIEIKAPLAKRASEVLKRLGYASVRTRHADGYYGWEKMAPFDAIMVTAAAPHVPPPLIEQLKAGGRLILPVGPTFATQDLRLVTKDHAGRIRTKSLYSVRFVPLTGSLGKDPD